MHFCQYKMLIYAPYRCEIDISINIKNINGIANKLITPKYNEKKEVFIDSLSIIKL
ncbi:MAG: hypothetical protein ACJAT7_002681 [Psychromonas sp.]|jgi:hypothetical protein